MFRNQQVTGSIPACSFCSSASTLPKSWHLATAGVVPSEEPCQAVTSFTAL